MHFYEASVITTKDGFHCQVYGNEHPLDRIIVKPKYIPTDKIECDALQFRFISGKKMNRLNMWVEADKLKEYLESFSATYPNYVFKSDMHDKDRMFFGIPIDNIERIYFPRRGLSELMKMPEGSLDEHLKAVYDFADFLLKSGLRLKDLGLTYSTLMGHYFTKISDINIVVYGKENFWKLMKFLEKEKHPDLRWKTKDEWKKYHKSRNRCKIFDEDDFVFCMDRKRSEGFFRDTLFVIFAVEKEEEVWFKWGTEKYKSLGEVKVVTTVEDDHDSVVRPGCYKVKDSTITSESEYKDKKITKVGFYSRDYCMLAKPGETIEVSGILEEVTPVDGEKYYRVMTGYFDSYINERRDREYIKLVR